jgi:hypothetical protein
MIAHTIDSIATILLIGMMLVPLVNIVTGAIVGVAVGGPAGGLVGVALSIAITLIENEFAGRRETFGRRSAPAPMRTIMSARVYSYEPDLDRKTDNVQLAILRG